MLVAPGASAGWAGLCLGGSLDGLASRHVRHASRRAEGLGLRLVSGWHTLRPVSDCAEKAWSAWAAEQLA